MLKPASLLLGKLTLCSAAEHHACLRTCCRIMMKRGNGWGCSGHKDGSPYGQHSANGSGFSLPLSYTPKVRLNMWIEH